MFVHRIRAAVFAALALAVTTAVSTHASVTLASRTTYLTFSKPVALPGVMLRPGTYIFELPEPDTSLDIVRVLSRDRKTVYFTAFTRMIERPAEMPASQLVSFQEVAPDAPMPITVWWSDPLTGRQFVYADR